jgi:hypothetical protein
MSEKILSPIVWITRGVATVLMWADRWLIDGVGVRGPATFARLLSYPVRMLEFGFVQWYALMMVLGLLGFGAYYAWR